MSFDLYVFDDPSLPEPGDQLLGLLEDDSRRGKPLTPALRRFVNDLGSGYPGLDDDPDGSPMGKLATRWKLNRRGIISRSMIPKLTGLSDRDTLGVGGRSGGGERRQDHPGGHRSHSMGVFSQMTSAWLSLCDVSTVPPILGHNHSVSISKAATNFGEKQATLVEPGLIGNDAAKHHPEPEPMARS